MLLVKLGLLASVIAVTLCLTAICYHEDGRRFFAQQQRRPSGLFGRLVMPWYQDSYSGLMHDFVWVLDQLKIKASTSATELAGRIHAC